MDANEKPGTAVGRDRAMSGDNDHTHDLPEHLRRDLQSAARKLVLLLDLDEVAAALKVSRRYVEDLVATGELPSVRLGRRRLVTPAALAAFVAALPAGGAA